MKKALGIFLCSALIVPATLAQQAGTIADDNHTGQQQAGNGKMDDDNHSLTGVHDFTLGSLEGGRNELVPSFSITQQADSDPYFSGAALGWQPVTLLSGSITLDRSKNKNGLQLRYTGIGHIYDTQSSLNTQSHQLGVTDAVQIGRSSLLLSDSFSYTQEATFGAGYIQPTTDLSASVLPNQSIYTAQADRIGNAAAGELDYHLSREDSITTSATYSLLHYLGSGYLSMHQLGLQTGYNRQIRHSTIGASLGFSRWTFENSPLASRTFFVQGEYGYRVTARLSFQAGAGPQFTSFSSGGPLLVGLGSHVDLTYETRGTSLTFGYLRGISGGAGVLATANSDVVRGGVSHTMRRQWRAGANGGFARNLATSSATLAFAPTGASNRYETVTAGAEIAHDFRGGDRSITLSYYFQDQISGNFIGSVGLLRPERHLIGLGFSWNMRPIGLR